MCMTKVNIFKQYAIAYCNNTKCNMPVSVSICLVPFPSSSGSLSLKSLILLHPSHSACLLTFSPASPDFLSPGPSLPTNSLPQSPSLLSPISYVPLSLPYVNREREREREGERETAGESLSFSCLSKLAQAQLSLGFWVPMRAVRAISAFHTLWCS